MGLMTTDCQSMENEANSEKLIEEEIEDLEWSPDQEILLLYSLHGFKPVGPVKFFNMFVIQERLSNAMNKQISSKAIWKKLISMYDLEALDEAEAEISALEKVEIDFALPESEFGELINAKLSGKEWTVKVENEEEDDENERTEMLSDIKVEVESNDGEGKETTDTPKRGGVERGSKKEIIKRGAKKKDSAPIKDNVPSKKENLKEASKKDSPNKNDGTKDAKKGFIKEEEKKDPVKKTVQDLKKDISKEDKKETSIKSNKRDSSGKSSIEQLKKESELKKSDQKKTPNQRGGTIQPRSETSKQPTSDTKRSDAKTLRSETPKPLRLDATTKGQRLETRKDVSSDKKKETPDKTEGKSPESGRGSKLRAREKKATEPEITGTKRERSKDSTSTEEPLLKKPKIMVGKSRPTRNSFEPQQKPASPSSSPQKRRSRP